MITCGCLNQTLNLIGHCKIHAIIFISFRGWAALGLCSHHLPVHTRSPHVGRKAGELLLSLGGPLWWSPAPVLALWKCTEPKYRLPCAHSPPPSPLAPPVLWAFTVCLQIPMQRGVKSIATLTSYAQRTLYHNGFCCAPAVLAGNLKGALWSLQSEINLWEVKPWAWIVL